MSFEPIGDVAARVVLGLTPKQQALREGKVTASFLPKLMAGDEAAILSEWRRLVGDPDYAPEDLSGKWAVQFGSYIEPFALNWHELKTGQQLNRRGEVVVHPDRPWFSCTLDAWRAWDDTVIDVKAPGHWRKIDDVLSYYAAQMVGQRGCTGAAHAALLVVHGGAEPIEHPIEVGAHWERIVWERVDEFWRCVETLTPPVALPAVPAPVKAEKVYDMRPSNSWATHAAVWLANVDAARKADGAAKELKSMVPTDASRASAHGVLAIRDRGGRISLRKDAS